MYNSGILVHVHHLESAGWEDLLCGDPAHDKFGSLAMTVYLLLTAPDAAHISTIVIGCGPSSRDGINEGEYTKRAMLQHFDKLVAFPRLKPLLEALSPAAYAELRAKIENIIITTPLVRTLDEVRVGAELFAKHHVSVVYQVCAASHAPRCTQTQARARAAGTIPPSQLWLVAPTDMCFTGTQPDDTVILEPPHKGDDNTLLSTYTLPQALKPVIYMPAAVKEELAKMITEYVTARTTPKKDSPPN